MEKANVEACYTDGGWCRLHCLVLKGAKPAELPVVRSNKIELIINHQTPRGLASPTTADEVIEMNRRGFISLLGSAAATWPLATRAQQAGKLPSIGILGSASAAWSKRVATLVQRLRELGHVENRTVTIEYRWTEGRNERYGEIAAELVRLNVGVIVALGTPAIVAAKKATSVIPIVFPLASDPVGDGLVASLARPGGNITGLSNEQRDLGGKRLEVLREIVPNLARLAALANPRNTTAMLNVGEVQAAAPRLGLEIIMIELGRPDDIAPAIEQLKGRAQALYVVGDPFVFDNAIEINTLALVARLPTMHNAREISKPAVLCPTGRASSTCSGVPAITSTRSSRAPSPPTSRSSCRLSSSLSSTSRPPRRSASPSLTGCSRSPTR